MPDFKLLPLRGDLTYFILLCHNLSEYKSSKKEETKSTSHSCIGLVKDTFPLNTSITELHMIRHLHVLTTRNPKQVWKKCPQWLFPTAQIMSKLDLKPISHPISNKTQEKSRPPHIFTLAPTALKYQPPIMQSSLVSTTDLHRASLFVA